MYRRDRVGDIIAERIVLYFGGAFFAILMAVVAVSNTFSGQGYHAAMAATIAVLLAAAAWMLANRARSTAQAIAHRCQPLVILDINEDALVATIGGGA